MIIFPPRNILTTQPLYTVILSEAKDLDFCCSPSFIDVFNTNNQVLRFAQDDIAKRFKLWKEIGCSLTNNHTSDPHHFHKTQPPHTVILSGAKDPDFCCCPSFIDVFNTNIQVLRFAQDDNGEWFNLWKEIGCSLTNDHTSAPHHFHQT